MKYENLISTALDLFPEMKTYYEEEINLGTISSNDGPHIFFDLVFMPLISKAIDNEDVPLLRRFFIFVENMENSSDTLVAEVAEFTVLEYLCDNHHDKDLSMFLGNETKKALQQIRAYMLNKGQKTEGVLTQQPTICSHRKSMS